MGLWKTLFPPYFKPFYLQASFFATDTIDILAIIGFKKLFRMSIFFVFKFQEYLLTTQPVVYILLVDTKCSNISVRYRCLGESK